MKLHGSIANNLENAVASAHRLRGHPVYGDTLAYWRELLHEGRRRLQDPSSSRPDLLQDAIRRLEEELARRGT